MSYGSLHNNVGLFHSSTFYNPIKLGVTPFPLLMPPIYIMKRSNSLHYNAKLYKNPLKIHYMSVERYNPYLITKEEEKTPFTYLLITPIY